MPGDETGIVRLLDEETGVPAKEVRPQQVLDRIQYVVAFLGFFMIFAMWLFPEVKREETGGGVRRDNAAQ